MRGTEAVIAELNWLVANGVIANYAIGGAVGAFQYIEAAFTEDVDVFVVFQGETGASLAPLGPIYDALTKRGAKAAGEYLVIGGWKVQFLPPGQPLYDDAIANARNIQFGDVIGRVVSPKYLAALALDSGRGKDLVRVEEFLAQKKVDKATLLALVERYNLGARWKRFKRRFLETNA